MTIQRLEISPDSCSDQLLSTDVLLCSQSLDGIPNVMTLTFKSVGIILGDLCLSIYISPNRYTSELLDQNPEFTISAGKALTPYIFQCGNSTGRDLNKFEKFGIQTLPGLHTSVPVVAEAETSMECKIVGFSQLDYLMNYKMYVGIILGAFEHRNP